VHVQLAQFSFYLRLKCAAWVSVQGLHPLVLPSVLVAPPQFFSSLPMTSCALVSWYYSRRPSCQEPKERHQHDEAQPPNSFSLFSIPLQMTIVLLLDLP
jgi:hypothetical protein